MTELGDDLKGIVVPGPLLELKTESGELLLEDAVALDVVGDDDAGRPIHKQQDRAQLRAQAATEITAGREPGDRVGQAEHHGVVAGRIQEVSEPLMLFLDVVATPFQIFITMIDRRVLQGRQRVGVRPVSRRDA